MDIFGEISMKRGSCLRGLLQVEVEGRAELTED